MRYVKFSNKQAIFDILNHIGATEKAEIIKLSKLETFPKMLGFGMPQDLLQVLVTGPHHIFEKTDQDLYQEIFPGQAFSKKKLDKFLQCFCQQLKYSLALGKISQDESLIEQYFLQYLQERDSDNFIHHLGRWETSIKKGFLQDRTYYSNLAHIKEFELAHSGASIEEDAINGLNDLHLSLDMEYLLAKLRITAELRSRSKLLKIPWNKAAYEQLKIMVLRIKEKAENPLLDLYINLIEMQSPDLPNTAYESAKVLFMLNYNLCQKEEQHSIFTQLINYTNAVIRIHRSGASIEQFKLYELGQQYEFILLNGFISGTTYRNMVVVATHLKKFSFAQQSMEKYRKYLRSADHNYAYYSAKAYFYFHKQEYQFTLKCINKIIAPDTLKALSLQELQIRSLYKLFTKDIAYSEDLENRLTELRRRIGRERKLSGAIREAYSNEIKWIRKIAKMKRRRRMSVKERELLLKQLVQCTAVMAREWIAEEIRNL